MRTAIVILTALILSACGGATVADKQVITRKEFPELFDLVQNKNLSALLPLLRDSGDGTGPVMTALLYHATMKGDLDTAREFIAKGADPNSADKYSEPLLHVVIDKKEGMPKRLEVIDMLLEAGADPNLKSRNDRTPLEVAMRSDAEDAGEVARRLLKAGADPEARNGNGETVLLALLDRWNEKRNKAELAGILLRAGADPNAVNRHGDSALHVVLDKNNEMPDRIAMVSMLLEAGADPNARNKEGATALNAAIYSDMKAKGRVIGMFLKHGADPNLPGKSGNSALHALLRTVAQDGQVVDPETAVGWSDLLVKKGSALDARNNRGKTPLSFAFFGDRAEIEKYLLDRGAKDYGIKNDSYEAGEGLSALGMGSAEIMDLNRRQCSFILREYDVGFEALQDVSGVGLPIRLKSPVGGITYRHTGGNRKFSIIDCRLAVVLAGWAPILRSHDVREVVHMRIYFPEARVGGGKKVSGHSYALAIDAAHFVLEDGTKLVMQNDWTDRRPGVEPCGDAGGSKAQRTLRDITCETEGIDLFSVILTPHFNKAHYDHLHMELTESQYMFVR